ncbi:response regulator transcription factor [Chloroflexota bacterium]
MNDHVRIMVVDDDPNMLKLLNHSLEIEGFDTVIMADGDSALTILGEAEPDLIILDTTMPEPDSLRTLDLIREHSNVPVIVLTKHYEVEELQKALFLGADDYISKPISTRSLAARIRAKLRRVRQETT